MEELYFDDEPIEQILYGEGVSGTCGPSLANIYLNACRSLRETARLCKVGEMSEAVESAVQLGRNGVALASSHVIMLNPLMSKIVGRPAMIRLNWNIAPLEALIERLWQIVQEHQKMALFVAVEPWIYRFYEHQGRYSEAGCLQQGFIRFYQAHGHREREAGTLNNFGFRFLLEKRWNEAAAIFGEAAKIYKDVENCQEQANSRANYWICRFFGLIDVEEDELESFWADMNSFDNTIGQPGAWHERKPLLLRAKVMERQGQLEEAVKLVKKAIKSSKCLGTRYAQIDRQYLKQLMRKKAAAPYRITNKCLDAQDFLCKTGQ